MFLTDEQQAVLNGAQGETMAKVWKTLVMYGDTFGADKMVPVTSKHNHLVTSFGLKALTPVSELMDKLIADTFDMDDQKFSGDLDERYAELFSSLVLSMCRNSWAITCFFSSNDFAT